MKEPDQFKTLREIGDLFNEGLVIFGFSERGIIYINHTAREITGLSSNDSKRSIESILELVIPEDREYLTNLYRHISEKPATVEVEFRMQKKDREQRHICCNAYLLPDGNYMVIHLRDITKPKQHENYLVEFGAKKNTLLDTLMHHINGALNLMRNLSIEAQKSITVSDNQSLKAYFSLVNENSKLCLEIIEDLLKEEHYKSPAIFVKNSRVDLVRIVSFILQELKQSYSKRSFGFSTSAPAVYINTDDVKFLQVVNNLTSNSIKFTPQDKPIRVSVQERDNDVIVSVADEGIGIPDTLKPFVFDRMGGAGRTGLNGERSLGMGLSICKNLMHLLRGDIWFESQEGVGSTFYLKLPKE